jgi:putative tricarboxylic transport membrane protein
MSDTATSTTSAGTQTGGRSEYGVALLLLGLGIWAIVDALGVTDTASRGPVNARTMPIAIGGLLILMAVLLTLDLLRGGRGEAEGGEDVDLTHGSDWRTIGLLLASFVANALLIDWAGWVISGTVLFWGSVLALGSRRYIRDGLISVALALLTYYGFYLGLGIALPAGLLEGIL